MYNKVDLNSDMYFQKQHIFQKTVNGKENISFVKKKNNLDATANIFSSYFVRVNVLSRAVRLQEECWLIRQPVLKFLLLGVCMLHGDWKSPNEGKINFSEGVQYVRIILFPFLNVSSNGLQRHSLIGLLGNALL